MDKEIGAKLRKFRRQASMSIEEAARICNLTFGAYQDCEAGNRRLTAAALVKLCSELGVPVVQIFKDIEPPDPNVH